MASGFSPQSETKCEGCLSKGTPSARYRRLVLEELCHDCARGHQDSIMESGHTIQWFCEKHKSESANIFCETHRVNICQICAVTSCHKSCHTIDLAELLQERKLQLTHLIKVGKDKEFDIRMCAKKIEEQSRVIDNHLQRLSEVIFNAVNEETRNVETTRDEFIASIHQEADEKIKKIYHERDERLKRIQEDASSRLNKIRIKGCALDETMTWTTSQLHNNIQTENGKLHDVLSTLREACEQAEGLMIKDEELMKDFDDVVGRLKESIASEINERRIEKIRKIVERISFTREEGEEMGRVDGIDEQWEHDSTFDTGVGPMSYMIGSISRSEVVIRDANKTVHVCNLEDKSTMEVIKDGPPCILSSTTFLDDGKIVCGTTDHRIIIYTSTWTHIMTINVPSVDRSGWVNVSIDKDGMILAALSRNLTIHVYNPADGSLVTTIYTRDKEIREIHSLSSGYIVVRTMNDDIVILNGSGVVKSVKKRVDNVITCSVVGDRSKNSIYVMYWNPLCCLYTVHNMTLTRGNVTEEKIMKSVGPTSVYQPASFAILQSEKLVSHIGGVIYSYRKTEKLDELLRDK